MLKAPCDIAPEVCKKHTNVLNKENVTNSKRTEQKIHVAAVFYSSEPSEPWNLILDSSSYEGTSSFPVRRQPAGGVHRSQSHKKVGRMSKKRVMI